MALEVFEGDPLISIMWEGREVNARVRDLERRPHWESHPGAEVFVEEYFFGDISVKRSVIAILRPQAEADTEVGKLLVGQPDAVAQA